MSRVKLFIEKCLGGILERGGLLSRGELFRGNCLSVVVLGGNYSGIIVWRELSWGDFHRAQFSRETLSRACTPGNCLDTDRNCRYGSALIRRCFLKAPGRAHPPRGYRWLWFGYYSPFSLSFSS